MHSEIWKGFEVTVYGMVFGTHDTLKTIANLDTHPHLRLHRKQHLKLHLDLQVGLAGSITSLPSVLEDASRSNSSLNHSVGSNAHLPLPPKRSSGASSAAPPTHVHSGATKQKGRKIPMVFASDNMLR